MATGRAAQLRVEVQLTSKRAIKAGRYLDKEIRTVSMELHHSIGQRYRPKKMMKAFWEGDKDWNLIMATPWGHEAIDKSRILGYKLIRVIKGKNSI